MRDGKPVDITDAQFQYDALTLLAQMWYGIEEDNCRRMLNALSWEYDVAYVLTERAKAYPEIVVVKQGNQVVVLFGGTNRLTQVLLYVTPLSLFFTNEDGEQCNRAFDFFGRKIAAWLEAELGLASNRFYLVGHSYGAALASVCGKLLRRKADIRDVQLLLYGCPRIGEPKYCTVPGGIAGLSYANRGDPIPSVPPNDLAFNRALRELGLPHVPGNFEWSHFIPPLQLNDDGTIETWHELTLDVVLFKALVRTDWFDQPDVQITQHFVQSYQANTVARMQLLGRAGIRPDQGKVVNEVTLALPWEEGEVRVGHFLVSVLPSPFLTASTDPIPARGKPVHLRFLPFNGLVWFGRPIARDASKKRLMALRKYMLSWLRRLHRGGSLVYLNMIESIRDYFAVASDADGEFDPPMSIE